MILLSALGAIVLRIGVRYQLCKESRWVHVVSMQILSIHISIMGYWRLAFGTDKRLEVAQQVPGKDDKLQYTLQGLGRHGRELRILYP